MEQLQQRMTSKKAQLEARAEDMRDPVTTRLEMAFIRCSPQVTTREVRPQLDRWLRQTEDAGDETGQAVDEQRERLMAPRRKMVPQV